MMANVEFSAKFDGLNLAAKNKVTLVLPENTTDSVLGKLVRMKGQELHVSFEDPQQEMDFDEERPERRVSYTTDQNGVVENVHSEGEQVEWTNDPDQPEEPETEDAEPDTSDDGEQETSDDTPDDVDFERDQNASGDDDSKETEDDLSDWEQEIMNGRTEEIR